MRPLDSNQIYHYRISVIPMNNSRGNSLSSPCVQAFFPLIFSPQSHLTWAERDFRSVRQWGHCECGRPCLLICISGRSERREEFWLAETMVGFGSSPETTSTYQSADSNWPGVRVRMHRMRTSPRRSTCIQFSALAHVDN